MYNDVLLNFLETFFLPKKKSRSNQVWRFVRVTGTCWATAWILASESNCRAPITWESRRLKPVGHRRPSLEDWYRSTTSHWTTGGCGFCHSLAENLTSWMVWPRKQQLWPRKEMVPGSCYKDVLCTVIGDTHILVVWSFLRVTFILLPAVGWTTNTR